MTVRCQRCSWTEGLVDRKTDHIEITYQDNSDPVTTALGACVCSVIRSTNSLFVIVVIVYLVKSAF